MSSGNIIVSVAQELEEHYYSSQHKRPLPAEAPGEHTGTLTELCRTALDVPVS